MIYRNNHRSDNMTTVMLCHNLINEKIKFDVEYAIKFERIVSVPIGTPNRNKILKDLVPKGTPDRKRKIKKEKYGTRERGSRFDVVIIEDDQIVGIIETKSHSCIAALKQIERYKSFGIPVYLCDGIDKIEGAVNFSKDCIQKHRDSFEKVI